MELTLFNQPESFHNTTHLVGEELKTADNKCKAQEEMILDFIRKNPNKDFNRDEVHTALFSQTKVPTSSVGRSLTNLYNYGKGKLIITGKRVGLLGSKQTTYKFYQSV